MPPSYPTATNDMQPSASDAIYIIESCPDSATSGMHVLFGKDGMKGVMAYGALSPACSVQVDLLGVHDGDTGLLLVIDGILAIDRDTFDQVNNATRRLEQKAIDAGENCLLQAARNALEAQNTYKNVTFEIGDRFKMQPRNIDEDHPAASFFDSQAGAQTPHSYTTETAIQRSFLRHTNRSRMSPPPPPVHRYLSDEELLPMLGPEMKGAKGPNQNLHDDAPSSILEISVLGKVELTVEELCAYHYRDVPEKSVKIEAARATLTRRLKSLYDEAQLVSDFTPSSWKVPTAIGKKTIHETISNYGLLELTKGLAKLPSGDGARHLTLAIQKARNFGRNDLKLSETADFIKERSLGQDLSGMGTDAGQIHPDKKSFSCLDSLLKG